MIIRGFCVTIPNAFEDRALRPKNATTRTGFLNDMNIFGLTCDELTGILETRYGKGAYHAKALVREVLKRGNRHFDQAREFKDSPSLTERLNRDVKIPIPEITRTVTEAGTVKFTTRMADGLETESVVIPMQNHNTLCLSCQIGCRMGCRFCETGGMGLKRNLRASEMTAQVYAARFVLKKDIRNIVFMGMGEPFDNFEQVRQAIAVLSDQRGFDIAPSHMTLSTAGLVPGIEALGKSGIPNIHLALSLNAPNDRIRDRLMPVNRTWPMERLKQALLAYPLPPRGLFLIGYVLIPGVNDARDHALELADFLTGLPVRVNLIPLNRTRAFGHAPAADEDIHRFASFLEERKVFVIKRWSRGERLNAACGQLGGGQGPVGF